MEGTLLGAGGGALLPTLPPGAVGEGRLAEMSSLLVRRGDPPCSLSPPHVKLSWQDAGNLSQSIDHRGQVAAS